MHKFFSFSLLCLFSLMSSSIISAGDNFSELSIFGFLNDRDACSSNSTSEPRSGLGSVLRDREDEDRESSRGHLSPVDVKEDDASSAQPVDDGSGVGVFSDDEYDDDLGTEYSESVEPKSVEPKEVDEPSVNPVGDDDSEAPEVRDSNMFMRWWKESTSGQVWGLAGMVAILSYGGYRLYDWWLGLNATKLVITTYDQECAKTLLDAMHEDIEIVKLGKRQLPGTNLIDLSKMTPEFAAECLILQHTFMNMYKSCQDNADNIVLLEEFYSNFVHAIGNLADNAEIIDVNEVVPQGE